MPEQVVVSFFMCRVDHMPQIYLGPFEEHRPLSIGALRMQLLAEAWGRQSKVCHAQAGIH